jgi:glycosyltransferase involved in cell wall biosynthesis
VDYRGVRTEPPVSFLRKLTREKMQRRITAQFDAIQADVEHWTYYNGLCRRPIRRADRPLVVTVLDFVHEAFESLDPSGKHIAIKQDAIHAADHLICISQSTHDEMCERFPAARDKASVIPLGTSLSDVAPEPLPASLREKPYVLFVGRRNSYKNFSVVWEAWNRLRGRLPADAKLVLVGPPMKRREATELGWRDDESAILIPNASDGMLRTLYEHSQAFLFPSKAEGFGLPSLEAMSAGAPVMVSDLPVMREVVGDCGFYFDPNDADMVASLILSAIKGDLPDKQAMIRSGHERAAAFNWHTTASQTANVYRRLIENRSDRRQEVLSAV